MNFLVVMSDEHRRDAMSCMGHKFVKTPALDRLAKQGTLFTNAYTPSPMCVPARASIACGDYVHRVRYWDSATPYNGEKRSWMRSLRDRGVETVSIGKLHFRSAADDNGFSEEILPMHVVDEVGWAVGLLRKNPPDYDNARELAADVGCGNSSYTDYDLAITQATEQWLKSKKGCCNPWAAFVSFVSPHYPLKSPADYYLRYDPAAVDLPTAYNSDQRPQHRELRNIANFFDYDRYFDEQSTREAITAYYGLCTFLDDCIARVLRALDESGQAKNTIILYVSDHGEMLGDHGFWTKQVMYEASAGVPMILAGPGIPKNKKVTTAASLLDIYPTALAITKLKAQDETETQLPGDSLIKLSNETNDKDRTILSEYHDGGSTTATFMIRWDRWKYIYYVDYPPQLFDLENDPQELSNLGQDANHYDIIVDAEQRLRSICDPENINKLCFSDQKKRIKELGGVEACKNAYAFNHTPRPK